MEITCDFAKINIKGSLKKKFQHKMGVTVSHIL